MAVPASVAADAAGEPAALRAALALADALALAAADAGGLLAHWMSFIISYTWGHDTSGTHNEWKAFAQPGADWV